MQRSIPQLQSSLHAQPGKVPRIIFHGPPFLLWGSEEPFRNGVYSVPGCYPHPPRPSTGGSRWYIGPASWCFQFNEGLDMNTELQVHSLKLQWKAISRKITRGSKSIYLGHLEYSPDLTHCPSCASQTEWMIQATCIKWRIKHWLLNLLTWLSIQNKLNYADLSEDWCKKVGFKSGLCSLLVLPDLSYSSFPTRKMG